MLLLHKTVSGISLDELYHGGSVTLSPFSCTVILNIFENIRFLAEYITLSIMSLTTFAVSDY